MTFRILPLTPHWTSFALVFDLSAYENRLALETVLPL